MSDRELLQDAAKAAGYTLGKHTQSDAFTLGGQEWNPLDDDGDALRLALACGMQVREREACWWPSAHSPQHSIIEDEGDDPYAATRRAIVRAAAEIGRNIK